MATAKSTGNVAKKSASKASPLIPAPFIQLQLRVIAVELRCALSTVTVAARALREQNADLDADVALVLQKGAGAPLHVGLERIEALLNALDRPSTSKPNSSSRKNSESVSHEPIH